MNNSNKNLFTFKDRMNCTPERVWVNQPSTLQDFHHYHGEKLITIPPMIYPENGREPYIRAYFTKGTIISTFISVSVLEKGWN